MLTVEVNQALLEMSFHKLRTRLLDNDTLNFLNALSADRLADHDGNLRKYSPALYGGK